MTTCPRCNEAKANKSGLCQSCQMTFVSRKSRTMSKVNARQGEQAQRRHAAARVVGRYSEPSLPVFKCLDKQVSE